ncbi:ATP-binding protein [Candidatus Woesearchaeota archaeon]|nr:ATP-binding protein [Candidatus Woesearchaeota archaeon]
MKREDLYFALFEQQKDFEEEAPSVKRELAEKVLSLRSLKLPIIITGVRRCGKSFLLKIIKNELRLSEKEYIYINFNDERFIDFSVDDFQKIIDFLHEHKYKEQCLLFIDEIQEVNNWEKWIDRIKTKYPIFITGSNSKLLSSEISTILTGRSLSLGLTPFTFREFLAARKIDFKKWELDLKKQAILRSEFRDYLQIGGFPQRVLSEQPIIVRELYEHILYRDIVRRFNKNQIKAIKEVSAYLLSNPSSLVSLRTISKMVELKNLATLKSIIDAFEHAFLFFFANKFDYSIKKQAQNPRKVYCVDNGFLVELGFRLSEDKGKLLENLVAVELKRRGKEIFYYADKHECDFVIRKGNQITEAIQVCYDFTGDNQKREMVGLREAMKKFELSEGLILTNEQEDELTVEDKKIKVIPVWKWLLAH